MRNFFDPESGLWRAAARFADILALSLLWLFLSLPLVTLGAATAALYDAAARCLLPGEAGAVSRFLSTFRRELKTASLATLLWGGVCAVCVWAVWSVRARIAYEGAPAVILLAVWFWVLLIPIGALCWMFPLLSRFTFTVRALIVTSLRLALGYLPRTVLIVAAALGAVMLSVWLMVPMLVLPCLVALLWARLMEGVFAKWQVS